MRAINAEDFGWRIGDFVTCNNTGMRYGIIGIEFESEFMGSHPTRFWLQSLSSGDIIGVSLEGMEEYEHENH